MMQALESSAPKTAKTSAKVAPILAEVVAEDETQEPIAKAVRDLWTRIGYHWNLLSAPVKAIWILVLIVCAGPIAIVLFKPAVALGILYCAYYLIWSFLVSSDSKTRKSKPAQRGKQPPFQIATKRGSTVPGLLSNISACHL